MFIGHKTATLKSCRLQNLSCLLLELESSHATLLLPLKTLFAVVKFGNPPMSTCQAFVVLWCSTRQDNTKDENESTKKASGLKQLIKY